MRALPTIPLGFIRSWSMQPELQYMKIPISCLPGKVRKHMGKWNADQYFPLGKCYKSVVTRCWTLQLSDISVSETVLRFILNPNSVCKGIRLYLHKIPDIDVAVCSRTYRYFEIKIKL